MRAAAAALLAALAASGAAAPPAAAAVPAVLSPPAHSAASPAAPTRAAAWIARLVAPTPAWAQPHAAGAPHVLAPFGAWTGGPVGLLVLEVRGDWLRVLLPSRPNGASAWIIARRVRLVRTRLRVEIDTAKRTLTVLRDGKPVHRYGAVVGAPATPTPKGRFAISELARQPDPNGFLGPFALHLTAHSTVLDDYGGGPGRVAIHGRGAESLNDPLGTARSHGCIRIDNAAIRTLARSLVPGVPVGIR